ncbi:DnaJ -like protein subfamily C member 7 [Halotydeus destructor]|nr:DnaJ -like protein subfamily C member 7 [Halotydeus destructor]
MDSDTAGLEPSEAAKRKIKKANKALNEGKHEQGIVFLSDAIELCPNNAEYVLKRGTALLNQKMYKEAMKDAILCRTLEPENIASSILLAKCHRAYGNFVIAENVLQLASSHDSTNKIEPLLRSLKNLRVDALRILELNLERKFTDANSLCNQLLSVAPECYTAKLIKCLSLTMMGQHGEAGKLVDSLLEVNPCDYEALFAKAQLMYYAEKYDEANVMLEQILVRPLPQVGDSAKAVLECIVNFIHAKDFAQTAVEKKDYETAIKRYEDALKIDVKHNLGNGKIHLILSMIHTRQRNLFKALDHCELSIQLDPMNEKAITKRIDLLEKLTFIDEAIEQTKKFYASLQSDDQSEIVRLEAEQSLSRSQGHYFVLSIIPSATDAEISAAYNKKLNYFASCERLIVVEDKMKLKRKEVDRAYAVLRDAKKRTLYDRQIGISRARQDSSGSDDELLAELRSVSTKTTMPVSMTQSMFTSIRLNDNGSKDKFVFVEKTTDSLVENEKDDSDKEEDFDDALTDSIEVVSDKEEAVADVQSPEVDHEEQKTEEPEMSPVEKEAQLKYSDGIQRFSEHDYLEAVQSFTDAIILCPTNPQYYVARSDAYLMIPKYAEVLDDAWKAVELDSASEKGYLRILACNLIFGHISQAEDIVGRLETLDQLTFKQWSDHLSKFKETVKVANDQLASFNYEETIKRCNEVLEKSPEFVQMKLLKAEALTRLNNLQLAENIVADLIDKDEAQADILYIRGLLAYYKDNLDVSLKILSDVQTKYPKHLKSKTQAVKLSY